MGRPIVIEWAADVRDWLRGTSDVERNLDRIADDLKDATKDADKFERGFEQAMKESERASDKASDRIAKDFDRIGDEASDTGREAGRNLAQNLGEGLSSGDLSDTVQDALGEMLGNISGPVSAAVAAGAAIALAVYNAFRAEAEKQKAKLNEMLGFTDLLTGELDKVAQLQAGLAELGGGDLSQGIKDARKYASELGMSFQQISDLVSGQINPATQDTYQYLLDQKAAYDEMAQDGTKLTSEQRQTREAIRETLATAQLHRDAAKSTAENVANMRTYYQEAGLAVDPMLARVQAVAAAIRGLPTTWKIGLDFYATDPFGQSLISRGSANYSPGHVSIANAQARTSPYSQNGG